MLLLAGALFGAEAVRAHRREPRVGRRSGRRPVLATMAQLGRRPASRLPAALARRPDRTLLRRAGVQIDADDVVAARLASATAFGGLGVVGATVVGGALGIAVGALLLAFGCVYPDLWLRSAAARRAARIERAAPAMLELVAAAVQAGVPLDVAIDGAARASGGELAEELERSRVSMALGRPRGEEYRDLSERTGAPTLAALGLALRLSDRLGVPLAESLRDQAGRSRAEAARVVQERAARAGPRVLAVVVFVLVPAALLPIAAAVALTVAGALGAH
jgi:Flp pilus assembly protein TadB